MSESEYVQAPRKKRAMTLSVKLDSDLEELCEHLGVSVTTYLVNETAKSVQRDRLSFLAKNSIEGMMSDFKRIANLAE